MAYLVKSILGEPRQMELTQIHEALKSGAIHESWLARDVRQDFWYSVAELIGTKPAAKLTLFCPTCESPIATRRIDVGLPVACGQCGVQIAVPDPEDAWARQRDEHEFAAARLRVIFGAVLVGAGAFGTLAAVLLREHFGGVWLAWLGPIFFGFGLLHPYLPRFLKLRKKLQRPHRLLDAFTQNSSGPRAGRGR